MMKLHFLIVSILYCVNLYSQNDYWKINRDSVRMLITDSSNDTYYNKLLVRYNAFDSTLSLADYRLLYFGFVYDEKYSAYIDTKDKEFGNAIGEKDFISAVLIADSVLKVAPFNLRANYSKALSLYLLDSLNLPYQKYVTRYSKLTDALLSTGSGKSCNNSIKVIYVSDEYELAYKVFQIEEVYGQSLIYPCDKLRVKPSNLFESSEIYFDISESFIRMQKMFEGNSSPESKKKKKKNK